jgi:hypothetical protein
MLCGVHLQVAMSYYFERKNRAAGAGQTSQAGKGHGPTLRLLTSDLRSSAGMQSDFHDDISQMARSSAGSGPGSGRVAPAPILSPGSASSPLSPGRVAFTDPAAGGADQPLSPKSRAAAAAAGTLNTGRATARKGGGGEEKGRQQRPQADIGELLRAWKAQPVQQRYGAASRLPMRELIRTRYEPSASACCLCSCARS